MPFFSIIIPLYNKENYIKNTIESVLNQTFKDYEIIVVDDGSTDSSLNKIKHFQDKKLNIYSTPNKGVSHARNYGINLARCKYIALLDSDDYWYNNHLQELYKTIILFPKASLYCTNYEIQYNERLIKPAKFSLDIDTQPLIVSDYFKSSRINSIVWTSASCFTKNSFKNLGEYNLELRTSEDLDLWVRYALNENQKIVFNPIITMKYLSDAENSLTKANYNRDRNIFIDTYSNFEKTNISLKAYLDLTRYAVALRCKINDENESYKKLRKEIDYKNINIWQRILLQLPKFMLISLKQFHYFLKYNRIYLTVFR